MYSKVVIVGNLVRDAELKYTQSNLPVVTDAIAYSTGFGDKKETSFIDFVVFGKLGESLVQYLTKGTKVLIEGELKQDQYVDQQGTKRTKYNIIVKEIRLLGERSQQNNPQQYNNNNGYNNQYNTNQQQTQQAEFGDDEQIPF